MEDTIAHPKHYERLNPEPIDIIEAWNMDFHLGCALKYICRAGYKDDAIQDLKKAVWYINRKIQRLENNGQTKSTTTAGAADI
jgi:hypothetical protein